MKILLTLAIALLMTTAASAATQFPAVTPSGKQVTVHTRLAPVVVHRLLPPYGLGKHVYQGRGR